jgi:PKD domain
VTINQAATQTDPTSTAPIRFTVVFSEPVGDFTNADVTVTGCGSGVVTNVYDVNQTTPDHKTFEVRVNGMPSSTCTLVASIGADKAHDAAGNGNTASTSTDNSVTWQPTSAAPVVSIISPAFGTVYAKGSAAINPLTVKASFTDPDNNGPWTYTINWDDNGAVSTGSATPAPSTFEATHAYTTAGVYTINVCVKDAAGVNGCAQVWIVVYDASGGFITGGGWLDVAKGSNRSDPNATGRANFGFNSQYKKGSTVPTGETEFNFQAGNMNFHSTSYTWLVVQGYKAQYRGFGTINGSGNYEFQLTAYDGDIAGGGGTDKFRIRITGTGSDSGTVYFDNRINAAGGPDNLDTADPQAISSGSIVIHKA